MAAARPQRATIKTRIEVLFRWKLLAAQRGRMGGREEERDGEMVRWRDGEMERRRGGEVERRRENVKESAWGSALSLCVCCVVHHSCAYITLNARTVHLSSWLLFLSALSSLFLLSHSLTARFVYFKLVVLRTHPSTANEVMPHL
jgi:hypothetical protein